jgi:hypothetical protein
MKKRSKKPFETEETDGLCFPLMVKAKSKVWKLPSLRRRKGKDSSGSSTFYLNNFGV